MTYFQVYFVALFASSFAVLPGHSDFSFEVNSGGHWVRRHEGRGALVEGDDGEATMAATKKAVAELFDEETTKTTTGAQVKDLEKSDGVEKAAREELSDEEKEKIAEEVKGRASKEALAAAEAQRARLAKLRIATGDGSWVRWDEVDGNATTVTTTAALLWSDQNPECLQPETEWRPLEMPRQNRSAEPDHRSCRARCASVEGCAHWSFYVLGGACFLQNASAVKSEGKGVVSGIPGCRDKDPHLHFGLNAGGQGCFHLSASFTPLDMAGQSRSKEESYDMCQARCVETRGCQGFTYFILDQGCHLQANTSHLVYLPGTIAGAASCNASDKAKFDSYIKQLPKSTKKETAGVPCEDSWAAFVPFDLPGDLDEPGDLAKDKEVTCEGLYSQHHRATLCKYSMQVSQRCPVLCGACGIQTSSAAGCADRRKDEHPLFFLGNETLSCTSLQYACRHDDEVDDKCKETCGWCTTTTTTPVPELEVEEDRAEKATGCSRRRSMGYCFTRRRRLF